jgi:hypothetical protein
MTQWIEEGWQTFLGEALAKNWPDHPALRTLCEVCFFAGANWTSAVFGEEGTTLEIETDDPDAQRLVGGLMRRHAKLLAGDDTDARNAVIIKMIALVALAFDIPPIRGEDNLDVDEVLEKLRRALTVIAVKETKDRPR